MTRKRNLVQAVGYVRTSSAANVGRDKDSERRQRLAIEGFAKSAGYVVVDWFNDPAVSGADPIESRPGFAALLNRIEGNGVRVVLVEDIYGANSSSNALASFRSRVSKPSVNHP